VAKSKIFISSVRREFAEERKMLYSYLLEDPLMSCGLTTQKLYRPHKSHPNNPLLAEPMHWCGYIEKAGTGTGDIVRLCAEYGLKDPNFEQDNDFKAIIWRAVTEQVTEQVTELLNVLDSPKSVKEILESLGLKHRPTLYESYIKPAIALGLVEMTEPDSPNSPQQKYKRTEQVTEQVTELLNVLDSPKSVKEILEDLGLKHRPTLYSMYITPAMDMGLIGMTEPNSPNSPRQKYRMTKKGETIRNACPHKNNNY